MFEKGVPCCYGYVSSLHWWPSSQMFKKQRQPRRTSYIWSFSVDSPAVWHHSAYSVPSLTFMMAVITALCVCDSNTHWQLIWSHICIVFLDAVRPCRDPASDCWQHITVKYLWSTVAAWLGGTWAHRISSCCSSDVLMMLCSLGYLWNQERPGAPCLHSFTRSCSSAW